MLYSHVVSRAQLKTICHPRLAAPGTLLRAVFRGHKLRPVSAVEKHSGTPSRSLDEQFKKDHTKGPVLYPFLFSGLYFSPLTPAKQPWMIDYPKN